MRRLRLWESMETESARPPHIITYQVHGAIAWLVGGYLFVAIHALVARALPVRWLGGLLWAVGINPGGVDTSLLTLPPGPGRTALAGLISLLLTLAVAALFSWAGRSESFLVRLWLKVSAYCTALGLAVSFLTDCLAPLPGGDARLLAAGLGAIARFLGHAWLLTPFALVLLLVLVTQIGQDLVRLAARLQAPGSDGFGAWALAPIAPGLILRCLWLAWAGWRLPERAGLWIEALLWLLTLAALSLVAYNWSRRLRRHPRKRVDDTTGLIWVLGGGWIALVGLLVAFGLSPAQDRIWVLHDPPAAVLQQAGTVVGNLALEVDRSGKIRLALDLALLPGDDPLDSRLAALMERPGAVESFWQNSAESLLRLALPGMGVQDVKGAKPLGSMLVSGSPRNAARRFGGSVSTPLASLTITTPAAGGGVRLDDLAITSATAATIVGLDAARQPVFRLPVPSGGMFEYSRNANGRYFVFGADPQPTGLAYFQIQLAGS